MSGVSMPWDVGSEWDRRLAFCRLVAGEGVNMSLVCRQFGISRKTGYKWLARFAVEGPDGLVDRSRRPVRSPSRTSPAVEELVCSLRRSFPAWGGRKIRWSLLRQGVEGVPAASTITDILRRNGLIGDPTPRTARSWIRFQADAPNQLWQMDLKGWFVTGQGRCEPFDVLDDHSRFSLCLDAFGGPDADTIQQALTVTFGTWGLPDRILCDNGSPWANTQPGFRWTRLGVWLLDLGVEVVHTSIRHPQTIGKDERFHQTLKREVITTQQWDNRTQVQAAFDQWRHIYNHQRPHDALDGHVPADYYTPSTRPFPNTIAQPTYPDTYHTRTVDDTARIHFKGHTIRIGKAFKRKTIAIAPTPTDTIYTIYYRTQPIRTIYLTK